MRCFSMSVRPMTGMPHAADILQNQRPAASRSIAVRDCDARPESIIWAALKKNQGVELITVSRRNAIQFGDLHLGTACDESR